jgi:calcineurin-like phosphoesterase family protein
MVTGGSEPPDRPRSMAELKFKRARMFGWLSPLGLVLTAAKVAISGTFARYADKRETEASIPVTNVPDYSARDEVWVDFVADLGDGFNPTYAVARQLARERLHLSDGAGTHETLRGQVLVTGGDQVYPTADENAYLNKFIGLYEAALPWFQPEEDAPVLLAIPGNHDWYDGLTSFMRLLCRQSWIGGWRTAQQRSYFAVKLPGHWWLWGIDIQFDTYIDEPQLSYFRDLAKDTHGSGSPKLEAGDRIILCTGKPSWVHEGLAGDEKYKGAVEPRRNLEYFEAKVVRVNGADVRIGISGDLHHYARYESAAGRQRITAGGGGAYLYPTHVLDPEIHWPDEGSKLDPSVPRAKYQQRAIYPDRDTSMKLRFGALLVPRTNPSFMALTALLNLMFYWITLFGVAPGGRGTADALHAANWWHVAVSLVRNPLGLLFCLLILGGVYGFADAVRWYEKVAMALGHGLAHIAAAVSVVWGAARLPGLGGRPFLAVVALMVLVGGALGGSLVMGAYLVGSQMFKRHPNENFSSQHIEDYKNFLRMRIRSDGTVTIFPVGLDRVPKSWRVVPDRGPSDPFLEPGDGQEQPHLIEGPIEVRPGEAHA